MWRWLVWGARIAATALLLSFLSIWTTGYIVNSYMETLLKQLNLPLQTQPFALSGVWGKLWGASSVPGEKEQAEGSKDDHGSLSSPSRSGQGNAEWPVDGQSAPGSDTEPPSGEESGAPADDAGGTAGESGVPPERDTEGAAPIGEGAVPVFGGGQGSASGLSDEQRQALNAIMSKLNGEQLSALSGYLQDGLTADELIAVQELLKPSLTESEYAQMMEALAPGRASPEADADESMVPPSDRE